MGTAIAKDYVYTVQQYVHGIKTTHTCTVYNILCKWSVQVE